MLNLPEFLANLQLAVHEPIDFSLLLIAEHEQFTFAFCRLQFGQLALRLGQFLLQALFGGKIAALCLDLQFAHPVERPAGTHARANADQVPVTHHIVRGIDDQRSVVRKSRHQALAQERLFLHPQAVCQQVRVGKQHHGDPGLAGLCQVAGGFRIPVRGVERRPGGPGKPGRQCVPVAAGVEPFHQVSRVGQEPETGNIQRGGVFTALHQCLETSTGAFGRSQPTSR